MRKYKPQSPIKVVKKTIVKEPTKEHAFIKKSRCPIKKVTLDNSEHHTNFDIKKIKKYNERFSKINNSSRIYKIHTHPKKHITSMLPSITDILYSNCPNVLYITDKKAVAGQVHFHIKNGKTKIFENFKKRTEKTSDFFKKNNFTNSPEHTLFVQNVLNTHLVNEIANNNLGKIYLEKNKKTSGFISENFMNFCNDALRYNLFNQRELYNYLNYKELFFNNKCLKEMYNFIGVDLKFVPNKKNGYHFDPKIIDFIKK